MLQLLKPTRKKILYLILTLSLLLMLVVYGGNNRSVKLIKEYISGKNQIHIPTEQEYQNAGLAEVNSHNIEKINKEIREFVSGKKDFNSAGLYYGRHYPTYRYDTNQSYQYDFNNSNATIKQVKIRNSAFNIGKLPDPDTHSIFLKVAVNSDAIGKFFQPKLIVEFHGKKFTHTFEHGVEGIRYINLTGLAGNNVKINLEGKLLTVPDQDTEIVIFKNTNLSNKTILVVATHPDDAEIAAFGLYSKFHKNSYILTVTAGDAGPDTVYRKYYNNRKKLYMEKGKRRTWDSLSVPAFGRVPYEHCINLGFFDGRLQDMHQHRNRNFTMLYTDSNDIKTFRTLNDSSLADGLDGTSNWNSLVKNITYLLRKIKPDIIVTPYSRIDRHPDHKYTTAAIFEALKQANIQNGKLFLYSNHPVNSEYFPFGKQGEATDLPPVFETLYFNSIYSLPMSRSAQIDKLFALESMSDLRYEATTSPFKEACQDKDPLTCRDFSYFRRAVRSNELFFVVDINKIYNKNITDFLLGY